MERFVRGDVVVLPFPFSDLTLSKRRPALVLATPGGDDLILCQITSQNINDNLSLQLDNEDFINGSLNKTSNIRPNRLFTADKHIILYKVGQLSCKKLDSVIDRVIDILHKS
ncbi:MAG TPA: growth inhibitor PemK [Candidatus Riflebacteria bacterium]|nr:growth inhibitor PemK [Candidatus Riflebacteria bacterium]